MNSIEELENLRMQLIQEINIKFDNMIKQLCIEQRENTVDIREKEGEVEEYESVYPMTVSTGIFKGKKPTGVVYEDGYRVDVPTWKKVVEEILKKCDSNPDMHVKLLKLRGKVAGRERVFLSGKADEMRSPIKISDNLYFETHYDTETLLRIMTVRILDVIHYDYTKIKITVRNDY